MGKLIDETGNTYGRLTVIGRVVGKYNGAQWYALCSCGQIREVRGNNLRSGHTTSCGCHNKEINSLRRRGKMYRAPRSKIRTPRLYGIWRGMLSRCRDPKSTGYKRYGGRGISICSEWAEDYNAFYTWAKANGYKDYLTIDRIDNDGNYEPENCRWATTKEQARNRSDNALVTINGQTHCLSEWAEIAGIKYKTVLMRYFRGDRGARLIREVRRKIGASG